VSADRGRLVRLFSGGVADQTLLSATNFGVGLILLRATAAEDYAHYMLAFSALLLVTSAQGALVTSPLAVLAPKKPATDRAAMIAALARAQWRLWGPPSLAALLAFALTGAVGWCRPLTALLGALASASALALLLREFQRQSFLIHAEPPLLLRMDCVYAALLVGAAAAATRTSPAAPWMVIGIGAASLCSALYGRRLFGRKLGWAQTRYPGALRECWTLGKWGLAGAAITWLHTQGWNYLLAFLRGAEDVAAPNAARLLLMPVGLLLTGVGQLLLPTAAGWMSTHGAREMLRRTASTAALLFTASLLYFALLWIVRGRLVTDLLRQDPAEIEPMLLAWGAVFAVMILRTVAMVALQAFERFDSLVYLAIASTTTSLAVAWWSIQRFGAAGSMAGIIAGELVDLCGIVWLTLREYRRLR
jgi:O-antigen/teichoic acid export membrane protein